MYTVVPVSRSISRSLGVRTTSVRAASASSVAEARRP
jgi:hypothetical protein